MSQESSKRYRKTFARHMGFANFRSLMAMSVEFGPAHYQQSWYLSYNPNVNLWFSWIHDEDEECQVFSTNSQNEAALKILGWAIQHYCNLFDVGRDLIRPSIAYIRKENSPQIDIAGWKIEHVDNTLPVWESASFVEKDFT